jgi:YHS domain-containing protein
MNKILMVFCWWGLVSVCFGTEPVSTSYWNNTAIGGQDTVAYHSEEVRGHHQQMAGQKRFSVQWQGANWYFASQASADKFQADPERYRPEYNGHCSNALHLGEGLIPTDGSVWEFFDEKLHLFYAERGRQYWLTGDWRRYRDDADHAWERLRSRQ